MNDAQKMQVVAQWTADDDAMIETAWQLITEAQVLLANAGNQRWRDMVDSWRGKYGERARRRLGMEGTLTS